MAAWPAIHTIPCGKHILLIALCVKSSNLEFVCVGFVSTSQEVTGVALDPMNTLRLSCFWGQSWGWGSIKLWLAGNLVHDRLPETSLILYSSWTSSYGSSPKYLIWSSATFMTHLKYLASGLNTNSSQGGTFFQNLSGLLGEYCWLLLYTVANMYNKY